MPEFWQFPTVSMGLGPLMAIYQVRLLKYLHGRGIADTAARKVWAGDDGPVRGNGKIVQEL
jgi:pyruvate dehydrogenase E1 component